MGLDIGFLEKSGRHGPPKWCDLGVLYREYEGGLSSLSKRLSAAGLVVG